MPNLTWYEKAVRNSCLFEVVVQGLSRLHEEMKVLHQPRQSARKEWLILPQVAVSNPQPYLIPKESE